MNGDPSCAAIETAGAETKTASALSGAALTGVSLTGANSGLSMKITEFFLYHLPY